MVLLLLLFHVCQFPTDHIDFHPIQISDLILLMIYLYMCIFVIREFSNRNHIILIHIVLMEQNWNATACMVMRMVKGKSTIIKGNRIFFFFVFRLFTFPLASLSQSLKEFN